jgi:hypothetical protein
LIKKTEKSQEPNPMIRHTFLILIAFSMIFASCESRRTRIDHTNLIPERDLVPILTDLYLTDGLMGMPRMVVKYTSLDSASTYNYIIEKHGYTREQVDKTLKYYFIKNPKKLIKIYDKVLGSLSEMESRIQKELGKNKGHPGSVWPGADSYFYPDPSGSDSAHFNIKFTRAGVYTLTAIVTLYPDDQSVNPGMTAFSCSPDSILTGKRTYIRMPFRYIKDGFPHKYTIPFKVPPNKTLYVRGSLNDCDNNPGSWEKHMIIKDISVIYSLVEQ